MAERKRNTSDGVASLTHLDDAGHAKMVAVETKQITVRVAVARAVVRMSIEAAEAVSAASGRKGDAVQVARIAAIMAAKKTSELIPLCHPVALTSVEVEISALTDGLGFGVTVTATALDRTGVEMEAMTAASVAALTLYDMVKGTDRGAHISEVKLLEKTGGKSGTWQRSEDL